MVTFLTVLHILVCVFLILVVLLQAGKGGGMGIAFGGGGGSQTVFGSSGAGNFLTRLTSVTATIFLVTSLWLAHYSSQQDSKRLQRLAEQKQVEKKADDDRATKLKQEIDKARESAQKPAETPVESTGAAASTPAAPAAPAALEKTDVKPAKKESAKDATDAPRKKKRSADSEGGADKAAKPAKSEAPAPPAAPPAAQ